jgi:hypothetical protein
MAAKTHFGGAKQGVTMHTITVRVRAVDFADQMTAMRIWLNEHQLEPSRFRYSEDGDDILIDVSFEGTVEAVRFSTRFNGGGTQTTTKPHTDCRA